MTQKPQRKIEVTLADGKKHELRFTAIALSRLEDKTGVSFLDFRQILGMPNMKADDLEKDLAKLGQNLRISQLIVMLWAGLLHEKKDMTVDEAGELFPVADMATVFEQIVFAYTSALGWQRSDEPDSGTEKNSKGPNPKQNKNKSQAKNTSQ